MREDEWYESRLPDTCNHQRRSVEDVQVGLYLSLGVHGAASGSQPRAKFVDHVGRQRFSDLFHFHFCSLRKPYSVTSFAHRICCDCDPYTGSQYTCDADRVTLSDSKRLTAHMAEPERIRLHITPFNPVLFNSVVNESLRATATNVFYHQVQSDPKKGFGYLELPAADGEKLQKKLHGAILQGSKMKVETARPEKKRRHEDAEEGAEESVKRAKKEKRKRQQGEIPAQELPEGRHVKRGWTEPEKKTSKDKKSKREVSKFTNHPELLLKTKPAKREKSEKKPEDKKSKKTASEKNVVHEFENTTKFPTFLRSDNSARQGSPPTFQDGIGWVDSTGQVVEEVKGRASRAQRQKHVVATTNIPGSAVPSPIDSPIGAILAIPVPPSTTPVSEAVDDSAGATTTKSEIEDDSASSSSEDLSESLSSSDGSDEDSVSAPIKAADDEPLESESTPKATKQPSNDVSQVPDKVEGEVAAKEVHPLEALYKRRGDGPPKLGPLDTSFSFFGTGDMDDANGDAEDPHTPYTKQDLQFRGLRSAAPTPDTATIGRRFSFSFADGVDPEDEQDEDQGNTRSSVTPKAEPRVGGSDRRSPTPLERKEESEFARNFQDRRKSYNDAWKGKRREAKKKERQIENRRLSRRVV